TDDRVTGGCSCARAADKGTAGTAGDRNERRRYVGTPARRRLLPLGAEDIHYDEHVARRNSRDGPQRTGAAARTDGRDSEEDRLLEGERRRTNAGTGERSPLSILRRRQRASRDHGLYSESTGLDPLANA